jgi:DMSO/TMAO reductase YedYZ molybdopterin-dependent catalytic subunit
MSDRSNDATPSLGPAGTADLAIGVLAVAAGLGAGELLAGAIAPAAAPVRAVATAIIGSSPGEATRWGIETFGTADKQALQIGIVVVTLVLGGVLGAWSRRRPHRALAGIGALGLVGLVAAATSRAGAVSGTVPGRRWWPALLATVVAVAVAWWLRRSLDLLERSITAGDRPVRGRRGFLVGAGGAGAIGLLGWVLGGRFGRGAPVPDLPSLKVSSPAPDLPANLDRRVPGISTWRTSADRFYRIDTALVVPEVDASTWTLTVDGGVDRKLELSYDDLLEFPIIERDYTLLCVSNEVGGPLISSGRWLGVRTRDVLRKAGIRNGADQILSRSVDGMTISTPIGALTDDREAMIAVGLNGEALPRRHGYPARLVTPGLYGFVGATKWLSRMTATTYAGNVAYWTAQGWATDAPVKTESRIDTPRDGASRGSGDVLIGGVAWAPQRGIRSVEVRIDDGPWQPAVLGPDANVDYWRQWYLRWPATEAGEHRVTVRATDGTGAVQSSEDVPPFPDGATGYPSIAVTIT